MRVILLAILIGWLNFAGAKAENSVHVCSEVPYKMHLSLGYTNSHGWQAKGWYTLLPGECVSPNIGTFANRYFYYYAEAGDLKWRGNKKGEFCISPTKAFHYRDEPNCKHTERFGEIDIGDRFANYTLTLTCDDCANELNNGETFGGEPRLKVYGKWCGTGHPSGPHPGAPIDRLDQVCHDHDRAYHRCNSTTRGASRTKCEADADLRMVANLAELAGTGKLNPEQIAYSSVMAATMVEAAKARYTWTVARNIEAEGQRAMRRVQRDVGRIAKDSKRTLDKHLQNAWSDLTRGPGKNNEICRLTPIC